MSDDYKISEPDALKTRILDNSAVNDQIVCGFCDRFLSLAEEKHK